VYCLLLTSRKGLIVRHFRKKTLRCSRAKRIDAAVRITVMIDGFLAALPPRQSAMPSFMAQRCCKMPTDSMVAAAVGTDDDHHRANIVL